MDPTISPDLSACIKPIPNILLAAYYLPYHHVAYTSIYVGSEAPDLIICEQKKYRYKMQSFRPNTTYISFRYTRYMPVPVSARSKA